MELYGIPLTYMELRNKKLFQALFQNDVYNTNTDLTMKYRQIHIIADQWAKALFDILCRYNQDCCSGCLRNHDDRFEHRCFLPETFYNRMFTSLDDCVYRVNVSELWHEAKPSAKQT